ncbi:unnamed protein product [Trichobilharzia szidati]|nr:unnamed protein product [Trichobilharzia szidati]
MEQKARRRSYYYPILQTLSHSSSLNTSLTCINELQHTGVDTESFLVNFLHKQRKRRHYNSESGLLLPETDNLSTPLQADSREGDAQCENNDGNNPEHDTNVNLCDDSVLSVDSKETETSTLPSEVHMNVTESENDASSESAIENSKSDENFASSSSPSLSSSPVDNDMENASKVNISKTDAQYAHETVNNNTTTTVNTIPPNDQSNVITASNIMKSNDAIDDQDASCDQTQKTTASKISLSKENLKLHKSVSFADEVGKSLTEIFILYDEDDEENDHSHEYEELYGVSYYGSSKHEKSSHSPYRRSKFEIFCEDAYLDFTHNKKNHHHTNENNNDVNGTYKHLSNTNTEPHYTWSLTFSQPASHYYEFRQKLERSSISLESISVIQSTDQPKTSFIKLSGTIKVKNIAFEKSVFLRLTKNNWKTFTDYQAVYSAQLSSGTWSGQRRYDTFVFNIIIQSDHEYFHPDEKIEFAICFTTVNNNNNNEEKTEYWDNYDGKNYVIEQRKFHPLWIGTGSLTHHSTEISSPSSDASISPVSETPPNNNKSISTALDRQHSSITSAITKTTPTPTLSPSTSTTHTTTTGFNTSSYTLDCRPNFDSFTSFTDYRAWSHYSGETSYY